MDGQPKKKREREKNTMKIISEFKTMKYFQLNNLQSFL